MQLHMVSPETVEVTVRVIDDIGNTAETSAKAIMSANAVRDDTMPSPRGVTAGCTDGQIRIKWVTERPKQARYLLVRLNGVDLDYVPVEKMSVILDEINDYRDISSLKVAWLDQNYELGEWADVIINCPKTVREEPVETGVDLANSSLLVAILGVAVCVLIYKKYLPR